MIRPHRRLSGANTLPFAAAVAAALTVPAVVQAQPAFMPVQGMLMDGGGSPVSAAALPVTFSVYAGATGGSALHSEDTTIEVDAGRFLHDLGTASPLDLAHFQAGADLYLGISIDGEAEMLPRIPMGTTAYAAYAGRAGAVQWGNIQGIPADIADGDNDTQFNAIAPLNRVGNAFGLATTGCDAGEGWIWNGTAWECSPAGSVDYQAGAGLLLSGAEFAVDTTTIQRRVTGTCVPGNYVIAINSAGGVECEPLPAATSYTGGTGVTLTGNSFAADFASVQRRVTGTCAVGNYMIGITSAGAATCEPLPPGVTYTASAGVQLVGADFRADTTVLQSRVTGACAGGQYMTSIAQNGTVGCVALPESVTYTSGTGILINAGAINVRDDVFQRRVAATGCAAGSSIRQINLDGTVVCEADDDTNTTYTAGNGLTLTGTQFTINASQTQARVSGVCAGNSAIQTISAAGGVTCTPTGTGDITSVNTGFGLQGGTTAGDASLSINTAQAQQRVTGTCNAASQKVVGINQDGSVVCAADANSGGTVSGVSVSGGLTGGGGGAVAIGVNSAVIQSRVTGTCTGANQYVTGVTQGGGVSCGTVALDGNRNIMVEMAHRANVSGTTSGSLLYNTAAIGWNNRQVYWANRIIIISNGRSGNHAASGHFDINMPPVGTWITGHGSAGSRQMTGHGIPLDHWEALYYQLPIGGGSGTVNGNFHIANYSGGTFEPPADWFLIAVRNSDADQLFFNVNGGQFIPSGRWIASSRPLYATRADCTWSGYVNNWDAVLNYTCPLNRHIAGAYSYHDNGKEDRRWEFYCCHYLND